MPRSNVRFTSQWKPAKTGGRTSISGVTWPGRIWARCANSFVAAGAMRTLTG